MRRFLLDRIEDETGVSGTGIVANGIQFDDGTCVMVWLTSTSSVAWYNSIEDVEYIHGHGGKTQIVWSDVAVTRSYLDQFRAPYGNLDSINQIR
jgi:hypothetical protein